MADNDDVYVHMADTINEIIVSATSQPEYLDYPLRAIVDQLKDIRNKFLGFSYDKKSSNPRV